MPTANLEDLTNDDLLTQLNKLCWEVGDRLGEYLDATDRDTLSEAFLFVTAVERAVECPNGEGSQWSLWWSKHRLMTLAADACLNSPKEKDAFDAFLSGHPELGAKTSNGKLASNDVASPRLEITDDDVYDALVEIHAADPHETNNFPCASGVRRLLLERQGLLGLDRTSDHSDLMRVVAALKRLEKGGRVRQELREAYGQRHASDWHPAEKAADDA